MIPIRLQLTNFLSYRDRVDIDFSQLHLACISGQNGAGKSSLLDAMTWALFGKARRTDDAIIFSSADMAEVILDFEYEGLVYRIQRRKSRVKTGTLDLFLQHTLDDGSFEWISNSEKSLSKTEERIVNILRMDYVTFTNASFFLQGRADQFSQQNSTERKRILSSILGLDIWDVYNKKAAEKRKKLEFDLSMIDGRIAEIYGELNEEPVRKARFAELNQSLQSFSRQKKAQEDALNHLRLLDNMLKEQKKQMEQFQSQLLTKRRSFDQVSRLLSARKNEQSEMSLILSRAEEITLGYSEWKETRTKVEAMDTLAGRFHDLREKRTTPFLAIERTRSSLEQEKKALDEKRTLVEAIHKELPGRKAALEQDQQAISRLVEQIDRKPDFENQLSALRLQKEDLSAENKRLRAEMDQLAARRDHLQTMQEPVCPMCGQELTPEHRITLVDEILAHGKRLGDEFRDNQARINDLDAGQKKLDSELQTIFRLETEKHALDRKADLTQAWLDDREPEMEDWNTKGQIRLKEVASLLLSESYANEERSLLAALDQETTGLNYDSGAHEELRRQEQKLRDKEVEFQQLERTRAAIAPLERQITDLTGQQTESQNELLTLEKSALDAEKEYAEKTAGIPEIGQAEQAFRQLIEEENSLRDEVAAARQKVEVLESLRRKKADLDKERESIGRLIGQYKQLERAFGKDGVPALLIEQALPEIESEANDLLDRLTAGEMSVRFITQRDYKDKNREDKKETLDIQISDATGVRDYEMFSGGEAFRVNFAIRLALSRVLAQRAGARLQTLVIDEGFGSQDAIGRQRLVEAINMVQNDFARILVITHLEELKDAFPSRIEVEKTSSGSAVTVIA